MNLKELNKKIIEWAKDRNLDKADCKAQMLKLVEESGELAYNEIKDRKGEMVNGIFVKEEDLKK